MMFRIFGGIAFLMMAIGLVAHFTIPPLVVGIFLLVAAVALLAGV